jgi:hypothetical protein
MLDDRLALDESDLLFHSQVTTKVYGNETVWIGDIRGDDPDEAVVTVGFKNLYFMGQLPAPRERFTAIVALLDDAQSDPQKWELLLPREERRGRRTRRMWLHPFRNPQPPTPPTPGAKPGAIE